MVSAIRSARLLLDSKSDLIQDGLVVIDGDRIVKGGSFADIELPEGTPVKDLGDVTLMPGLFDCHVHLQFDPYTEGSASTKVDHLSEDVLYDRLIKNGQKLLDAGVTTARDVGSYGLTAITVRDKIAKGEILGPRLQVSLAPITVPNGHAANLGGQAQGVEEVRAMVKKHASNGADLIKVMSTGGFMTAGSHPSQARYTLEELEAIVDEAKKAGIPVTTHATGTQGIERAADARLDGIEHCAWITETKTKFDERVAKKLVDNEMAICPTMNTACVEHNYFCPWDSRKAIVANLSALRETGAKMIVGTDAGISLCRYERYVDGLTVLADAGYTNREIIASATDIAAEVCRLSHETGKISPGLAADLAAFEGNPLEDIHAFGKPAFVMARGQEHELTPIAPVGDTSEIVAKIVAKLRQGAGMKEEFEE